MTCMHPYLMWNIGYPLGWSIVIGCLCLLTKAFFALPMYWLIRMLAFHSNVSVVPILGCLRRLLLLWFIKLDSAPKCGVAWFIMKDFLSWILLKIIFWLVVCIMPTTIKMVNQSWTCLQFETILFKYMLSPAFLELSGHPDMDLIPCSKRLIVVSSMFFSMDSS